MVRDVVKMKDIQFEKGLFENWMTGKIMDELLCSYKGLPKGVNYMVIGDPGVGKTTIILDLLSDLSLYNSANVLFVSAEMNEIDLAIYVQRFPKFQNLDILFVEGEFEQESHSCKTLERLTAILDQYSQKLHLYITLGMTDIDITQLTDDEYQIIEEMGYGNLNSIEHDRTLQALDYYGTDKKCWDVIQDKDKFNELRRASRKLDRIKHVLDAYRPDLIIIMNWEDRMDIFEGLEINEIKDFYIDKLRSVYEIPEYNTKVIWTNHPGARSISVYERLALIGDTARELLNVSK